MGVWVPADLDVITPPLDGTILPGITRASTLELVRAHPSRTTLPGLSPETRLHAAERELIIPQLAAWADAGRLLEAFTVGIIVAFYDTMIVLQALYVIVSCSTRVMLKISPQADHSWRLRWPYALHDAVQV